jgi:hypothetical protein
MEALIVYFIPSLMILFLPIALAVYTAGCIYERRSWENAGPVVLLNIILAISIAVIILDKQVSTLLTMAMASYGFIAALVVVFVAGLFVIKSWLWISTRLPLRFSPVRNDQTTLSQSFPQ